jgi:GNAT superfamily N-acetyltransferase
MRRLSLWTSERLGAVWWVLREPPLLRDGGSPLPELAIAVDGGERGKKVGRALLDALVERARGRFLALNVHLLNPAVHSHAGRFQVASAGRGAAGRHESAPRLIAWSFTGGVPEHSAALSLGPPRAQSPLRAGRFRRD